jgi:hypothetical protein
LAATPVSFVTVFEMNRPIPPKKAAPAFFLTLPQSLAIAKISGVAVLWCLDRSPFSQNRNESRLNADRTVKGQGQ